LAEEERSAIRRKCQTTKLGSWLLESEHRYGLAMSEIEEFNSAVGRKIRVQEVDSVASNGPVIPITNINRQAGFLAGLEGSFPDAASGVFGVIKEPSVLRLDRIDAPIGRHPNR
jgi:hypothetical protein